MAEDDRSLSVFDAALKATASEAADDAGDAAGALRASGLETFKRLGVPSRRVEDWKFTDLRRLLTRHAWQPVEREAALAAQVSLPAPIREGYRAVFVDGWLRADLSDLPTGPGVRAGGMAEALVEGDSDVLDMLGGQVRDPDHAVIALNAALMQDGLVLTLGEGVTLDRPLEIVWLASGGDTPRAWHPRSLIRLGANARATVIERFIGGNGAASLANQVSEVALGDGAHLTHTRFQEAGEKASVLTHCLGTLGRDARIDSFGFDSGAGLARHEADFALSATGGQAHFGGIYMGHGRQHMDNTLRVRHQAPHGTSRQVFKGVLNDRAHGVFQGRIQVARAAQKTDAHQLHKGLLLHRGAEVDAKPELEIFADDVKCSHGATTGELDRDALFYLRARGVPEVKARAMLVEAFLAEALDEVADETVRAALAERIAAWMAETMPEERKAA
jgi:Fe-S cluster assembly protein SufD